MRLIFALGLLAALVTGIAVGVATAAPAPPLEKVSSFSVILEIQGQQMAFFKSVGGLSMETEVVEFREGGTGAIQKLPGRTKYPNIVLKKGFLGDRSLYDWHRNIVAGQPDKRNGKIIVLDLQAKVVATFSFTGAFPVKWEGPELDASSNELAIETIEIAHEGWSLN